MEPKPNRHISDRGKTISVFVSSLIRENELKEERRMIKQAVQDLQVTQPWLFECSGASSEDLETNYLDRVKESHIFIQVLDKEISMPVIKEYRAAKEKNIPCLVFLKKNDGWSPELNNYINEFSEKWTQFETLGQLYDEVQRALKNEIVRLVEKEEKEASSAKETSGMKVEIDTIHHDAEITGKKIEGMDGAADDHGGMDIRVKEIKGNVEITGSKKTVNRGG